MKSQSTHQIKSALKNLETNEQMQLILRLMKYKKDNKELVSYLLYNANDETLFIEEIKLEIDEMIDNIKGETLYKLTKQIRKILRQIQKPIKYSGIPETQIEILIHFCQRIHPIIKQYKSSTTLQNIYIRQVDIIEKAKLKLHEDIQYDYKAQIEMLHKNK